MKGESVIPFSLIFTRLQQILPADMLCNTLHCFIEAWIHSEKKKDMQNQCMQYFFKRSTVAGIPIGEFIVDVLLSNRQRRIIE